MVIDSSAVIAILLGEPVAPALGLAIDADPHRLLSAATLVELGIVVEARTGGGGAPFVERFLRDTEVEIVAVDREMATIALDGWRRFGKGRHPARLNLGDCFTYALATQTGEPVLCVGDDFARTDIEVVGMGGAR